MTKTSRTAILFLAAVSVCLSIMILAPSDVSGHDPEEVSLDYDRDGNKLTVEITHRVADTSTHYVNLVEVFREGNKVLSQSYTTQPDPDKFKYTFDLEASGGDEIKVRVTCNQLGDVEEKITVDSNDSSIPFAALVAGSVASAVITGSILFERKRI